MDKIVVPTKFNKTGKRVLKTPVDERRIYAPADKKYRRAFDAIQAEWLRKWNSATREYVESMAHWIASYVARDSTPAAEKHRIVKFLAERSLSQRWSNQLGRIPELARVEEENWEAYVETCGKADEERAIATAKASADHNDMKRALWREIADHIHYQYHPEDKPWKG